jgi:hypothetical protein
MLPQRRSISKPSFTCSPIIPQPLRQGRGAASRTSRAPCRSRRRRGRIAPPGRSQRSPASPDHDRAARRCPASPPSMSALFSSTQRMLRCPTQRERRPAQDGLEQWPDCTAAGTYTPSEGAAACAYYRPMWAVSTYCASATCTAADGSEINVICTAQDPLSGAGPNPSGECVCWGYEGSSAGHVRRSGDGCECPESSDPTWQ